MSPFLSWQEEENTKNAASVPIHPFRLVSMEGFTPRRCEQSVNNMTPNTG
jgi:hypothetical protein